MEARDLEACISDVIRRYSLRNIFRLKIGAVDVVSALRLLVKDPRLIVVILPPNGGDDLIFKIKDAFSGVTVITYRSFNLDDDEVILAF